MSKNAARFETIEPTDVPDLSSIRIQSTMFECNEKNPAGTDSLPL